MTRVALAGYAEVFRSRSYRRFWLGFTFSALGDAMTRVALVWFVLDVSGSARALGLLSLCYTGPVLIGGLVAGSLLDRFDRRAVMIVDNLIRGSAVALIPLLHAVGRLELWHVYAVAASYGLLMMISLAGGPSLIPALVPREQLITVNALEILGYTLGSVVGPPAAGLLIGAIGAPRVLLIDALSYLTFALALAGVRAQPQERDETTSSEPAQAYRLSDAFRLMTGNAILRSTTLMFMAFNVGLGFLFVWLPIFAERTLDGGASLYGLLLGTFAAGQLASSLLAGAGAGTGATAMSRLSLGSLICLAQGLSGLMLLPLLASETALALTGMALFGFCSAPLTIWAQTLRMDVIPERLRGRTFALLRMLMQGAGPAGGTLAGFLLPVARMGLMIGLTGAVISLPGLAGSRVKALRSSRGVQRRDPEPRAAGS